MMSYQIKVTFNQRPTSNKEAVRGCSFLYIIAKKSVIMSMAFLVDVSIPCGMCDQQRLRPVCAYACRLKILRLFELLSLKGGCTASS